MNQYQLMPGNWVYNFLHQWYEKVSASLIQNYSEYLDPIELTTDWVYFFNFEKIKTNTIPPYCYFRKEKFFLSEEYKVFDKIKLNYVHELQQMYFLTSKSVLDENNIHIIDPVKNIRK